jgi:hypothetical protein
VLNGVGNLINGTIGVDDHTIEIVDGNLSTTYSQSAFDQSYACTENLVAIFPSQ